MRSFPMLASVSLGLVVVIAGLAACGQRHLAASGDAQSAYSENRTTVIGSDTSGQSVRGSATPAPGDCIDVGTQCVTAGDSGTFCERSGGPSDAIVVDGKVVETVCYPPPASGAPEVVVDTNHDGNLDIPQNANNTTVTFDPATDGTNIAGDLTIDGNNVAVYGNGAGKTIIDGTVTLDGNNVRLRGLTITGDLILNKNNMAAVLVEVQGNIIVNGNNDVVAACDDFGNLTVGANNTVLVQNRVQGTFDAGGHTGTCAANTAFSDANHDGTIADGEIGAAIPCP